MYSDDRAVSLRLGFSIEFGRSDLVSRCRMGVRESSVAFMPYGPRWRTHRKLFTDFISVSTVENYDANQIKVVSNLLVNLHRRPQDFKEHLDLYALPSFLF